MSCHTTEVNISLLTLCHQLCCYFTAAMRNCQPSLYTACTALNGAPAKRRVVRQHKCSAARACADARVASCCSIYACTQVWLQGSTHAHDVLKKVCVTTTWILETLAALQHT